ncbi:hypothetical protein [Propionicimonas sp.]
MSQHVVPGWDEYFLDIATAGIVRAVRPAGEHDGDGLVDRSRAW